MLTVVVAVDLPGTGEPGVGTLDAAVGAGAVLGSPAASLLVGTRALDAWFALGVTLCGLPVTLVGAVTAEAAALVLLACVGVGNALIDVGGFTLRGRTAPDDVLARVFGVLESPVTLAMGTGGDRRGARGRRGRRPHRAGRRRPAVPRRRGRGVAPAAAAGPVHRRPGPRHRPAAGHRRVARPAPALRRAARPPSRAAHGARR